MADRNLASVGQALADAFVPPISFHGPAPIEFVVDDDAVVDGVAIAKTAAGPQAGEPELIYVSPNLAALIGSTEDELLGHGIQRLFGVDAPIEALIEIDRRLDAEADVEATHVLRHDAGRNVAVHATHSALPNGPAGERFQVMLVRDLARRSSDKLIADQAQVLESLARGQDLGAVCHQVASHVESRLEGSGRCWIGVSDLHRRLEAVVTGGEDLDLVGQVLRLIMSTGDPTTARCVLVSKLPSELGARLVESGIGALWAFPCVDNDGTMRGALVVAHPEREAPGESEVRMLHHLSQVVAAAIERAAAEASLAHRVLHDPLTHLPNRALIVDRLEQALARLDREPSSLAVLLVDIDHFKSVNDTWGTEVGDEVLVEVANRLLAAVRMGDTVGRISSDQFLMVCSGNGDVDAGAVARRVMRLLEEPVITAAGNEVRIGVSVGVVGVESPSEPAATIISNAESALARAVDAGRGRYALFDQKVQRQVMARQALEQSLHRAIVDGELVLHYQPVCEVATGRMVGAEALVRWDRPGHGLLGPAEFIDVAEETGLIVPLGAWVIEEAARQLALWPKSSEGRSPVVTVNLSARQLCDDSLVPTVLEALEHHRIRPVRLGFEVTESMRIDNVEKAVSALTELSDLGCRIAIDDFGIGYATLDYLRRFSMANVIKIDRSFVEGIGRSREDAAIVDASRALAASLNMQVVAEGVEHISQLDHLRAIGCDYAQGYALSTPVPIDAVVRLWEKTYLFEPVPSAPPILDPVEDDDDGPQSNWVRGTSGSRATPAEFKNPDTNR